MRRVAIVTLVAAVVPIAAAGVPGPAQPVAGATSSQESAQFDRYEELLRMWEESRRLDSEHEDAARRCDREAMARIRAELNARYMRAQTVVQTLAYVEEQTGASGVPAGFHPPRHILDRILELTDKADKRRPKNCGGQEEQRQPPPEQPRTTGSTPQGPPAEPLPPEQEESSGMPMPVPPEQEESGGMPPPSQPSTTPPAETSSGWPAHQPSPAENAEERAHALYNQALNAAMACDEEAWRRAIAELERLLAIVDSELELLRDPIRRRERLKNTPATVERLTRERAQIIRYIEAARAFKLRCVERNRDQRS